MACRLFQRICYFPFNGILSPPSNCEKSGFHVNLGHQRSIRVQIKRLSGHLQIVPSSTTMWLNKSIDFLHHYIKHHYCYVILQKLHNFHSPMEKWVVLGSCKEPEVILCIRVAVRRVRPVYSVICQSAPRVKSVLVDKIEQGWNMGLDLWGILWNHQVTFIL